MCTSRSAIVVPLLFCLNNEEFTHECSYERKKQNKHIGMQLLQSETDDNLALVYT